LGEEEEPYHHHRPEEVAGEEVLQPFHRGVEVVVGVQEYPLHRPEGVEGVVQLFHQAAGEEAVQLLRPGAEVGEGPSCRLEEAGEEEPRPQGEVVVEEEPRLQGEVVVEEPSCPREEEEGAKPPQELALLQRHQVQSG
jgi:hypothetical protein